MMVPETLWDDQNGSIDRKISQRFGKYVYHGNGNQGEVVGKMEKAMDNSVEASSLTFTSSSYLSNGASSCNMSVSTSRPDSGANLELVSLRRLSSNLEKLLLDSDFDSTDAEIIVDEIPVGVHRCILSAQNKFFHKLFSETIAPSSDQGRKPQYEMDKLVPRGKVGYEALMILLSYLYTGKLKPSPVEVSTCCDTGCAHDACRPAISFIVELMYASSLFQIEDLVSLFQRRLVNFVEKALVEDIIPLLQVAFHCHLTQLLSHCVHRVARSNLDSISIEKELPPDAAEEIKLLRLKSDPDAHSSAPMDPGYEQRIRKIYKALDSDDVELVKLLLKESSVTLADANGLHYAVAYGDCKIISDVLELGFDCINLKNQRGYTPLHVAAMRREPTIIGSLLDKGACLTALTEDGRCAITICRRLTRAKEYSSQTVQGRKTNNNKVCIDMLEREMRRNPVAGIESVATSVTTDDLYMRLLYLEDRVALAKLLFPTEATVAMKIAQAETTSEFSGVKALKNACGNLKEVDLNEAPSVQHKRLRSRMDSLIKTVVLGRRYFPHCSQVLDNMLEDELSDLFSLDDGSLDEQGMKRLRFCELKEEVQKAFFRDKAVSSFGLPLSSSSSSSPLKDRVKYRASRK